MKKQHTSKTRISFLLLLTLLLASAVVQAQPVITTFAPVSGAIGSSVTITGTGFNTTAAQNIVFFGATQATVTAATANSLTVTVPLGATYQYLSVTNLAVNLTAYSKKPFIVTLAGTTSFVPKVDFATDAGSWSVSIGDIDGDSKPDLAVANRSSSNVSVLRNTSTLSTVSFATKVDFTTGSGPNTVIIGDIDGDGKPDLAVANENSNTVSVLRNTSISGTVSFAAKVDFATGTYPYSVSMGDLDRDGKPDLAVANGGSNTVSVFRNTSTSGTVSFVTKVDFATGTHPQSVSVGDIDGNGKPDLVVTNFSSSTVSVLRNTSTSGTVNFATKVDFATSINPYSISIGDIDGNGKPDLAVTNLGSSSVSVLRNTSTSGAVSFAAKVDFATGSYPYSVSIGDIDGDNRPDLAVANIASKTVSVLRNTSTSGTMSFESKADYATGTDPTSVSIGDIDGDGRPDIAVSNQVSYSVSVLRQVIPPIIITTFAPANGAIGSSVTITGKDFNTTASQNIVFFGATQATVTAATATSLTITVPLGATYQLLSVTNLATNQTAYSAKPFIVTLAGSTNFLPKVNFATGTAPVSISIGDLDGDGKPDLALANQSSNTISVLRNTSTSGTVSFANKVDFATGTQPLSISIADIDGDGKLDLAVANYDSDNLSVLRNTSALGTISFAANVDFTTGGAPLSLSIGDIDSDGKPDLVAASSYNNVSVLLNTSISGTINFATNVDFATGTSAKSLSIGDIDGNGKPDLTIANNGSNTVTVLRNTSTWGIVNFAAKVEYPTGANPWSVSIGDIDGNGKPDLVVANFNGNTTSVLRNTSAIDTISFATKLDFAAGSNPSGDPSAVNIGDIDGDGKPDLAVTNLLSSTVSVLRNTSTSGTPSFATKVDFTTGGWPASVGIGDIDGDGRPDLTVANQASNSVSVIRQVGPSCIAPTLPTLSASSTINCGSVSTTLSIASGTLNDATSWQWYSGSCGGTLVGTGNSIVVVPAVTTTYYVRGDGGCVTPGTCASFTIAVNPVPAPTITGNTPICQGSSTTLNAGVFVSYVWSTGATTQTISVNTAGTFTVTVTNVNGCSGTASVTTSLLAAPVITGNLTPCIGSSTTLSTGVYASYSWSTGATTQSIVVSANGTYIVTVTNSAGCTATASAKVVKKALPVFTVTPTDTNLCPPVVSVVLSTSGNATSYNWSPGTGLNQTTGSPVTASPLITTTYTVTGTNAGGCTATKTAKVTVKPKPINLTNTNITATSAKTNWTLVNCAVGYTVQYRVAGGVWITTAVNTNTPTKTLTGLVAATNYNWRVRTKFANGTFSAYTNPVNFTTPALRIGETVTINALQVYPNPATDKLTLEFPFTEGDATIAVVNALGQTILTQKNNDAEGSIELSIQSLTEGLYFVSVKNGDNTFNSRFVKK